ncbi:hypothetical protein [Phosphitispora fastidiosa]|uniref:hypothetical protein n=1 Tax=Phosphitispora fastidiosa TaxID=2837202 RepID=UPI001E344D64|nr:hypothetical protein [Phosphitispora fastidiosa]MBU7005863.1 hypothetical protein [Phosphitispora fastidiosa]
MSLLLDRDMKKNIMDEGYLSKAIVTVELEIRKVKLYQEKAHNIKVKKYFQGQENALHSGLKDLKQCLAKLV